MCNCSFLSESHFSQIADTFDEAFADYHLKSRASAKDWLYNRGVKNAVQYDCSVGAFDGDKMVGFTLVGVDHWMGEKAAFDAGTGIIPGYRGRGLARQMFDLAVPRLKERKVTKFLLEVLQVNQAAIKAYTKTGFEITREFDCFRLNLDAFRPGSKPKMKVQIRPIGKNEVMPFAGFADWQPSWENSFASLTRIPDEVLINAVFSADIPVGLFAYYPHLNWIMSLVVKREYRRKRIASALLADFVEKFGGDVVAITLNNVDHSDQATLGFLEKHGFAEYARQYEMALTL